MFDAPRLDRFDVLRALLAEAERGETLSDKIRTVDFLKSLAHDRGGAPRDLAELAGLRRAGAPAATIGDIARRLLAHMRDGEPWTLPEPREPARNNPRRHAAEQEISS